MDEKKTETPDTKIQGRANSKSDALYWADVLALLADKPEPTVDDFITAMCAKGNARSVRDHDFSEDHVSEKFIKQRSGYVDHEISHICPRLVHLTRAEYGVVAFQYGLRLGIRARTRSDDDLAFKKSEFENDTKFLREFESTLKDKAGNPYFDTHPHQSFNASEIAMYVAAGMYMREKIDALLAYQAAIPREDRTYANKKAWCENWAKTDGEPIKLDDYLFHYDQPYYFDAINKQPAALLDISKQEWQAIKDVATGVSDPEETRYPKRLQAVKEALIKTGICIGQSSFIDDAKQKQTQNRENPTSSEQRER